MKHRTLSLYNSYDKNRAHDIHLRSIARAAPVCYATGFNLCLVGFPFRDPLAEVLGNTTIGEGGRFLEILASRQEFFHGDDISLPQELIVTTSKPDEDKSISLGQLVDRMRAGMDVNVIVGLGRKGLPNNIRKKGRYHLDITGQGVPFETCTAIGYIPAVISALLQRPSHVPKH
jgi:hypothetical protein